MLDALSNTQQWIGLILGLAAVYVTVVRPITKSIGKHWRDSIAEVVAQQQQTNATLQRVEHQVHPNGGASAHDYARKAYEEAQAIRAEQKHQSRRQDHLQGEVTAMGWRLQQVVTQNSERAVQGREALVRWREALATHGITMPLVPGETDDEDVSKL